MSDLFSRAQVAGEGGPMVCRFGRDTLPGIVLRVFNRTDCGFQVEAGRTRLWIGHMFWDLGDWIVERNPSPDTFVYDRPTEAEALAYGLTKLELKG